MSRSTNRRLSKSGWRAQDLAHRKQQSLQRRRNRWRKVRRWMLLGGRP